MPSYVHVWVIDVSFTLLANLFMFCRDRKEKYEMFKQIVLSLFCFKINNFGLFMQIYRFIIFILSVLWPWFILHLPSFVHFAFTSSFCFAYGTDSLTVMAMHMAVTALECPRNIICNVYLSVFVLFFVFIYLINRTRMHLLHNFIFIFISRVLTSCFGYRFDFTLNGELLNFPTMHLMISCILFHSSWF